MERRAVEAVRSIHEAAARVRSAEKREELAKGAVVSEPVSSIRAMSPDVLPLVGFA